MVSLGLFNWLSDLESSPYPALESSPYPAIFDDLWAADGGDGPPSLTPRCLVDVMHSYDRSVGENRIGMMEFIGGPSYESIVESFGEEEWGELEEYQNGSLMHMILNEPVLIMFQSPDTVLPLTSEDSELNFYHWESYGWWICINQEWNAQLAKILERNSPDAMKEFADCRVGR